VGALQIFYQSGYPTSNESKERGEKLLDQAISQLIDLKSVTDSRLELFEPAAKEIESEQESASNSYQEIFGVNIADSMIAVADIQSALKASYMMLAMQLKAPSIMDSFG
jgi:flagellin-like hook-associated protein FlgL